MSLKIKMIEASVAEEFEDMVNLFGETHNVIATQTRVYQKGDRLVYSATVFYQPDLLG